MARLPSSAWRALRNSLLAAVVFGLSAKFALLVETVPGTPGHETLKPCPYMGGITLFARRLAQRRIDAVLPAGAIGLEKVEHVTVDTQRHHLLGARHRLRRRQVGRLGGRRLEGLFSQRARIDGRSP